MKSWHERRKECQSLDVVATALVECDPAGNPVACHYRDCDRDELRLTADWLQGRERPLYIMRDRVSDPWDPLNRQRERGGRPSRIYL